MFRIFLLSVFRNLYKERVYTVINVLGLGLAIACCFGIGLYVHNELNYDSHNADSDRIYRVVKNISIDGEPNFMAATSPQIAPLFANSSDRIESFVRFQQLPRRVFRYGDTAQYWDDIYLAEESTLTFFSHDVLFGDAESALVEPNSVVVSESFATSFFGSENPIGQVLSTDSAQYQVTAVFRDLPVNSHLQYDVLLSRNLYEPDSQLFLQQATPRSLLGTYIYTYFKTAAPVDSQTLASEINAFASNYTAEALAQLNMTLEYAIQPLRSVHYDARWSADQPTGNSFYLYGLVAVATFVLLIASVNYTNISIARSVIHQKVHRLHKVLGAKREHLALYFILDSLIHTVAALLVGLLLIELARVLPEFNSLYETYSGGTVYSVLFVVSLFSGLVAGVVPALYLSASSSAKSERVDLADARKRVVLQKALVFTQFFVSMTILIGTILMLSQLMYVQNKPLGFEPENRLMVDVIGADAIERLPALRQELLQHNAVVAVAEASQRLDSGRQGVPNYMFDIENHEGVMESIGLVQYEVGPDYLSLLGAELLAGRDFREGDGSNALIVNESLVRRMGWVDPIGRRIGPDQEVVGVVADYHLASLREEIAPLILLPRQSPDFSRLSPSARSAQRQILYVQLAEASVEEGLAHVEDTLSTFQNNLVFEYKFFTTALADYYESDTRIIRNAAVFAFIGMAISFLGVFCITALNLQQSVKEIGIRKVLGATIVQLANLFISRQLLIILTSGFAASIVAYLGASSWLQGFAYHTEINLLAFPAVIAVVALISISTIGIQAIQVARKNPVEALRYV